MVVHSNQARDHCVAGAIHLLRTRRNLRGPRRADGLYFSIRDHDRLIFLRRCTGSIDDPDMVKNEDWRIDTHEVYDIGCVLGLCDCDGGNQERPKQKEETHFYTPRKTSV